jgi:ribosomal protein S18 acetylase RimI-like enzyme
MTGGYIFEAERIGTWKWLDEGRDDPNTSINIAGDSDEILLTRFGDEVIGTIVIRGHRDASSSPASSPRKSRRGQAFPTKGVIRGWTVKRRYRHKGIGTGLLEEAVALCQQKDWAGPEFAEDHAHSAKVVPATFQASILKREQLAKDALEKVKAAVSPTKGGKKGRR